MIVYGKQVCQFLLKKHPELIKKVIFSKKDKDFFSQTRKLNIEYTLVDNKKAQALSRGGVHQGILMEIESIDLPTSLSLKNIKTTLVLVGVTDMGNIGSIIRSSYALGFDSLFISGIKQINIEGAIKTSSGAIFDMPVIHYINPYDLHNELKTNGFKTIGATLDGVAKVELKKDEKIALFMGSENSGIPKKLETRLDYKMTIPMHNGFDSLNVGHATAILIDRIINARN